MINETKKTGFSNDPSLEPAADASSKFAQRVAKHLEFLYPGSPENDSLFRSIEDLCSRYRESLAANASDSVWDETDSILITYGDNIREGSRPTLDVLGQFLSHHDLARLIPIVHLLPINPYTSDDGFSVVDYRQIDQTLGDWTHVDGLNEQFDLMLDLVLNHCSQSSDWFQQFLARKRPYVDYFIEADPAQDHSQVVRPRSLPLLSEKQTADGQRHVWTTFSEDQVDLNFESPDVLLEFIDILLLFASHGARLVRLDAIAYLWKEMGTSCIHLPQTHEVVKLMRTIVEEVAPNTLLLTETNVPHQENISYFGEGDEAQMVYQFSLPPLLLDGYLHEDANVISQWLESVCQSPPGTTFFNFTASHDGIGVRPLEGLVSSERLNCIVDHALARGGRVGKKANSDGTKSPYELNVTYLDMLLTDAESDNPGIDRFMASQAIMLAMKGIPGIYIHSLVGTQNDFAAVEASGIARRINRRKFECDELNQRLSDSSSVSARVFRDYQNLLSIRGNRSAFHPDADQEVIKFSNSQVLGFRRNNSQTGDVIQVFANFSAVDQTVELNGVTDPSSNIDLLSGKSVDLSNPFVIPPFGIFWLTANTQ